MNLYNSYEALHNLWKMITICEINWSLHDAHILLAKAFEIEDFAAAQHLVDEIERRQEIQMSNDYLWEKMVKENETLMKKVVDAIKKAEEDMRKEVSVFEKKVADALNFEETKDFLPEQIEKAEKRGLIRYVDELKELHAKFEANRNASNESVKLKASFDSGYLKMALDGIQSLLAAENVNYYPKLKAGLETLKTTVLKKFDQEKAEISAELKKGTTTLMTQLDIEGAKKIQESCKSRVDKAGLTDLAPEAENLGETIKMNEDMQTQIKAIQILTDNDELLQAKGDYNRVLGKFDESSQKYSPKLKTQLDTLISSITKKMTQDRKSVV